MTAPRKACPVCWQPVAPGLVVEAHLDGARGVCPASGEPYRITLLLKLVRPEEAAA